MYWIEFPKGLALLQKRLHPVFTELTVSGGRKKPKFFHIKVMLGKHRIDSYKRKGNKSSKDLEVTWAGRSGHGVGGEMRGRSWMSDRLSQGDTEEARDHGRERGGEGPWLGKPEARDHGRENHGLIPWGPEPTFYLENGFLRMRDHYCGYNE